MNYATKSMQPFRCPKNCIVIRKSLSMLVLCGCLPLNNITLTLTNQTWIVVQSDICSQRFSIVFHIITRYIVREYAKKDSLFLVNIFVFNNLNKIQLLKTCIYLLHTLFYGYVPISIKMN